MLGYPFEYSEKENENIWILKNVKQDIDDYLLIKPDSRDLLEKLFTELQYFVVTDNSTERYKQKHTRVLSFIFSRNITIHERVFIEALLNGNCVLLAAEFKIETTKKENGQFEISIFFEPLFVDD